MKRPFFTYLDTIKGINFSVRGRYVFKEFGPRFYGEPALPPTNQKGLIAQPCISLDIFMLADDVIPPDPLKEP